MDWTYYQRGLNALKVCLPNEELRKFDTLAAQLKENVEDEELFRETRESKRERSQIIYALTPLARNYCGKSFIDLCENPLNGEGVQNREHQRTLSHTSQPPSPRITYKLLTKIMPTAYCYNRRAVDFPFVTVTIDNTAPGSVDTTLLISVLIENYSDTNTTTVHLLPQSRVPVLFLPVIKPTALATLNTIKPATLRILVEQTAPSQAKIYEQTEDIKLHARNTALLAVTQKDGTVLDLTDYLAAWVTPHHLEVKKLLRKAKKFLTKRVFVGYPGTTSSLAEEAKIVNEQVQAIFEVIKKSAHLAYIPLPSMPDDPTDGQITQSVRLPSEALAEGGSANCLDGAVLFASLLESIGIQPLIVLVPGHAIVGWRISKDVDQFEFLDTTLIEDNDFRNALETAQTIFEQALLNRHHKRDLFDPNGFARIIDIAACRKKGIDPLE